LAYRPDLIEVLETNQLVARKSQPYPRRALGRGTIALLVMLRIYVAIAIPIVIYAFVHALTKAQ
jgi:hypothetical protein